MGSPRSILHKLILQRGKLDYILHDFQLFAELLPSPVNCYRLPLPCLYDCIHTLYLCIVVGPLQIWLEERGS
jgi:hypothetical protein